MPEKNNKIPTFYMILPEKYFSRIFLEGGGAVFPLPPVSYAYAGSGRVGSRVKNPDPVPSLVCSGRIRREIQKHWQMSVRRRRLVYVQIIDKGGLKFRGTAMHSECFRCGYCNKLLANEHFAPKDDKQFCSDCYGQLFAKRCTRCQKPITGSLYLLTANLVFKGDGVLFSGDLFVSFFLCFFVSLSATLREKGWTDLHEIFREGVE